MLRQPKEYCDAIEGFAIETKEGLIFTVKGLVHPPERRIAYLRYLPDTQGDRKRKGKHYRRVYQFEEQQKILHNRFPDYLHPDPVFGIEMQGVPRQDIRQIYDPCKRMAEIRGRGPADPLEESALEFTELLRGAADVPVESLGISGSVLIDLHRPESDLDLVVYGKQEGHAVHEALCHLLANSSGPVRRLNRDELAALHASHRTDTPLSFADFARLQSRKVNEGRFNALPYFIRFVKHGGEIREKYGDHHFKPLGSIAIECRISDHRNAIFTPCLYGIEDVVFLSGETESDLRELASFRGRFSDQVRAGERAMARGRLERVTSASGEVHHRLTVGGQAGDYLLSDARSDRGEQQGHAR